MNAKVKQLWLAALRGGEYIQGKNALHPRNEYCCLGVLCELHRRETSQGKWEVVGQNVVPSYVLADGYPKTSFTTLPQEVQKWAGFTWESDITPGMLADKNDKGATFEAIADVIEAKL